MIDLPDAPWIGDFYDYYRNRFYGLTDEPEEDDEEGDDEEDAEF